MSTNREAFLARIADKLGRPTPKMAPNILPSTTARQLQGDVVERAGAKNCVDLFKTRFTAQGGQAEFIDSRHKLATLLTEIREKHNLKRAVLWDDTRIQTLEIANQLAQLGVELTDDAMQADLGVAIAEWAIAETGTVAVYNRPKKPRATSLVPNTFLVLVNEHSVVPTLNYVLDDMSRVAGAGDLPSCINFIAGPSSSADIELELVIGIHGPTHVIATVVSGQLYRPIVPSK